MYKKAELRIKIKELYNKYKAENKKKISTLIAHDLNITRSSVINYINVNNCINEVISLFDTNYITIAEINKLYKLSKSEQLKYYNKIVKEKGESNNAILNLQNTYKETNIVPTKRSLKNYDKIVYKFKRWNKALIAAKITPRYATKFTKEQIIILLNDLAKKLKRTPTMLDIKKAKKDGLYIPHAVNIRYIFNKNWNEILIEAGLEINREGSRNKYKNLSDEEMLLMVKNELIRLKTNSSSQYEKYRDKSLPSVPTLFRKFGRWSDMLNRIRG